MRKKISTWIVVLVMILSICAGSVVQAVEPIGPAFDNYTIYEADVILKGFEGNSGQSWYSLFKSFQDPLYYELTDYLLEDKVLLWESNFWNAAFNQEFQFHPSYFYEVILMGFLNYEEDQEDLQTGLSDDATTLLLTIYKEMAKVYEDMSVEDMIRNLSTMSVEETIQEIGKITSISGLAGAVEGTQKVCSTGKELIEAASEYLALQNVKTERIEILKAAKENVADNDYFVQAVDDIIEKMENTPIEYVKNAGTKILWKNFLDDTWELIVKASPIQAVLQAINIEKLVLDVLFNPSERASDNFKLLVVYIVDTYFQSAMEVTKQSFCSERTVENARMFSSCFKAYLEYQIYGLEFTKSFIGHSIHDGALGGLGKYLAQIFYREYGGEEIDEEHLLRYCDSQKSVRSRLLSLFDRLPKIFYSQNGLMEIQDALGKVPVTSIAFEKTEVTLKHKSDIHLVNATVYPQNATNQTVTYTSSDPKIISVPKTGGFISIYGTGTVTITAVSEDGGFTATQKISVENPTEEETEIAQIARGTCGDDIIWVLYEDGTLSLHGSGEMDNFGDAQYTPWNQYRGQITKVRIGENITSIGSGAFSGCIPIREVIIGKDVRTIGNRAFKNCEKLTNITIPNNVANIGEMAFCGCLELSDMTLSDNLVNIGEFAFKECKKLSNIIIPDRVTEIGDAAFSGCVSLKSINIPDGITEIRTSVLGGCANLQNVNIPNSITSIGDSAFRNCTSLQNINIPDRVVEIGESAFEGCVGFQNIMIPDSVIEIGDDAFKDCLNIQEVKLSKSITEISSAIFMGCSKLQDITIPEGVTHIRSNAFRKCISLQSIGLPDSLTSLSSSVFEGCTGLKNINLPDNVTEMDDFIFENCTSLQKITIPDGVTDIHIEEFKGCTNLQNIELPDNLETIQFRAFEGCTSLRDIELPNNVKNIEDRVFKDCINLQKIELPNSIKKIEDNTFEGCVNLQKVTIPKSVNELGKDVFLNCPNVVAYVYNNSDAFTYVKENGIKYVIVDLEEIPITGITLNKSELFMSKGQSEILSVIIEPSNTTEDKNVVWQSSDENIATVDRTGKVTAVSEGTAIITAKVGNKTAKCTVTVQMPDGWQLSEGNWYYYENGTMVIGWKQVGGKWYYMHENGIMASDEWVGEYYVDKSGVWITNLRPAKWIASGGKWWYQNEDGTYPANCWKMITGKWYYFDKYGYMVTGWLKQGSSWYYLQPSGEMVTGWQNIGGCRYYFNESGVMQCGWQWIEEEYYYFDNSGAQVTGRWVGDYYLKKDGVMARDEWVDNDRYYVDSTGKWVPGKTK